MTLIDWGKAAQPDHDHPIFPTARWYQKVISHRLFSLYDNQYTLQKSGTAAASYY
jgi:hypothetical protein